MLYQDIREATAILIETELHRYVFFPREDLGFQTDGMLSADDIAAAIKTRLPTPEVAQVAFPNIQGPIESISVKNGWFSQIVSHDASGTVDPSAWHGPFEDYTAAKEALMTQIMGSEEVAAMHSSAF